MPPFLHKQLTFGSPELLMNPPYGLIDSEKMGRKEKDNARIHCYGVLLLLAFEGAAVGVSVENGL